MHYDLHANNVLVEKLSEPIKLCYEVKGRKYSITTRYISYIFDWDNSYAAALGPNDAITKFPFQQEISQRSNSFRPGVDLLQLACTLTFEFFGKLLLGKSIVTYTTGKRFEINQTNKDILVSTGKSLNDEIKWVDLNRSALRELIGEDQFDESFDSTFESGRFFVIPLNPANTLICPSIAQSSTLFHTNPCIPPFRQKNLKTPFDILKLYKPFKAFRVDEFDCDESRIYRL